MVLVNILISSIVALSKYNIEKENCFYAFLHIITTISSCYMYVCMCVKILQYIKVVNSEKKAVHYSCMYVSYKDESISIIIYLI